MKKILIKRISEHLEETVQLSGWVYNTRRKGKIGFLIFRDGTGLLQCIIVRDEIGTDKYDGFKKLTQETSIIVQGKVVANERAVGGYELQVSDFEVVHACEEYPITPKEHGTEFLMSHRHLWLRSRRQNAILKVRHEIIKAVRDFFDSHDFTLVDTPILTPNAAEGTTTLFETEYFGEKAYLCQTGQLYGEANCMAFGRQYNFGPTFRAEKSKTRRHLIEFWMVEPEIAYCEHDGNIEWSERFIVFIVQRVLENRRAELEILERDIAKLEAIQLPFPRVSYSECVKFLQDNGIEFAWGDDFGSPEETLIAEKYDRPVVVDRFPASIKAFYMKRDPENEDVVLGMDVLAPEGYGEIIGGSQREHDFDTLLSRIKAENLPVEDFEWYLDLRRYGSVPHAGFGMGI